MHACQHNISHISCSHACPSVFSPAVVCPKLSAPGLTTTCSKLSDISLTSSCSKPPEFSIAATASLPSLTPTTCTKSASFSLSTISANLPSLAAAACSQMPKSSLNAVCSKHSVTALAFWSLCTCYGSNILVHMPQILAIDLATAASVIAAPANATLVTHISSSQTLTTPAFVDCCRYIAQPACIY